MDHWQAGDIAQCCEISRYEDKTDLDELVHIYLPSMNNVHAGEETTREWSMQ
jgi:hypothetical protein